MFAANETGHTTTRGKPPALERVPDEQEADANTPVAVSTLPIAVCSAADSTVLRAMVKVPCAVAVMAVSARASATHTHETFILGVL